MTEQLSMRLIVKELRKYSGRGRLVLIGPVRVWVEPKSGRDMYGAVAVTHDKTGRECLFERIIFFGGVSNLCDACVEQLAAAADVDEITAAEAEIIREDLIGLCRCHFKRVRAFQTERALADAMVEFFPGEKSERLHASMHADPTSV